VGANAWPQDTPKARCSTVSQRTPSTTTEGDPSANHLDRRISSFMAIWLPNIAEDRQDCR
jgi:hypothetical protein